MSYVLDFGLDAQTEWRALDVAVQEVVLDEFDRLTADPSIVPAGRHVHDFVYEAGGTRHYLFFEVRVNESRRTVSILSVGHFAEPLRPRE
jgi:hypothetical protein